MFDEYFRQSKEERPMPRKSTETPTERELAILQVLWECGPSTVREIHLELEKRERRDTGYSTTLKMVQVMMEKELLQRDDTVRPQVYRPAMAQEETQLKLLDYLIQKGFGGSAKRLVLSAVSAKRLSKDELAELRKLLDKGGRQ
jgi:BlaI family transcriptional regulator, penicillinase repressor